MLISGSILLGQAATGRSGGSGNVVKPLKARPPDSRPAATLDMPRVAWGLACGLGAAALYMLFVRGVVGDGIPLAVLGMATAASILTLNGLGWGARRSRPDRRLGENVTEVLPPADVAAILPLGDDFRRPARRSDSSDTPDRTAMP